jgi:hypothetical protein
MAVLLHPSHRQQGQLLSFELRETYPEVRNRNLEIDGEDNRIQRRETKIRNQVLIIAARLIVV